MTADGGVFFRFLIAALATWRLAFLVARERGPWGVFARVRQRVGRGVIGELLECVKCGGLWIAVPFAFFVGRDRWELIVVWLALAGATALIDECTRQPFEWHDAPSDVPVEQPADRHLGQALDERERRGVRETR